MSGPSDKAAESAGPTAAQDPLAVALLEALRAIALRAEVAGRLAPPGGVAVLRSVVDATVILFAAEAASLALYEPATDRLVFRVAAGSQGDGVVGLAIAPDEGVAGYVFTTGQPLALSDVASDARFGRQTAEQTGYAPRSLVAVPLQDDEGTIGVLEVLDKHNHEGFDLHDIELASVFARQATVAIRASRVERDTATLVRSALVDIAAAGVAEGGVIDIDPIRRGGGPGAGSRRRWRAVGADRRDRPSPWRRPSGARPPPRAPCRPRESGRAGRRCPSPAAIAMSGIDEGLPAWSAPFASDRRASLMRAGPFGRLERSWAFGDGLGAGVTVAIVDSGIEGDHPAVDGALRRSVRVEIDGEKATVHDDDAVDVVGHGTACASIIHALAPMASLLSVRVLGPDNRGKGLAFAAGLEWAIDQGASVINLSLSSRSEAMFDVFHDLADRAYFAGALLVCAANNVAVASYPSLFAAVISVAAHDVRDPDVWFYNPGPAGRVRGARP